MLSKTVKKCFLRKKKGPKLSKMVKTVENGQKIYFLTFCPFCTVCSVSLSAPHYTRNNCSTASGQSSCYRSPPSPVRMAEAGRAHGLLNTFLRLNKSHKRASMNIISDSDGHLHVTITMTIVRQADQAPRRGGRSPTIGRGTPAPGSPPMGLLQPLQPPLPLPLHLACHLPLLEGPEGEALQTYSEARGGGWAGSNQASSLQTPPSPSPWAPSREPARLSTFSWLPVRRPRPLPGHQGGGPHLPWPCPRPPHPSPLPGLQGGRPCPPWSPTHCHPAYFR